MTKIMDKKIIEEIKKLFENVGQIKNCDYSTVPTLGKYFKEISDEIKSEDNFGDIFNSTAQSNLRSWDNCRRVFHRAAYQRNPDSADMPTPPECKCNICGVDCNGMNCRICNNSLALNLAFYLSSWGMYRSSFLKKYDHTVHIGAVKILMESKYLPLFDPLLWKNKPCLYKKLVKNVYERLFVYYALYASKKTRQNGNTYNVTDTLITKIILGVYGCMPSYDRYVKKAIYNIGGTNKITLAKNNLDLVMHEVVILAHIFYPLILHILKTKTSWDKCDLYTPMKILDMILFSLGK